MNDCGYAGPFSLFLVKDVACASYNNNIIVELAYILCDGLFTGVGGWRECLRTRHTDTRGQWYSQLSTDLCTHPNRKHHSTVSQSSSLYISSIRLCTPDILKGSSTIFVIIIYNGTKCHTSIMHTHCIYMQSGV